MSRQLRRILETTDRYPIRERLEVLSKVHPCCIRLLNRRACLAGKGKTRKRQRYQQSRHTLPSHLVGFTFLPDPASTPHEASMHWIMKMR